MKILFGFAFFLLLWAGLASFYDLKQYEYIPLLGNVQYFCSRSGVEYVYFEKAQTFALHVDKSGQPIECNSRGVHL